MYYNVKYALGLKGKEEEEREERKKCHKARKTWEKRDWVFGLFVLMFVLT